MKKLLYLFFIILVGCAKAPLYKTDRNVAVSFQQVNVGTTANDHTGDPLRTAFIKQNSNWTLAESTFGNIYTETQTETLINDSLNDVRLNALELGTHAWLQEDTAEAPKNIVTWNQLQSFAGGGGTAGKFYILSGNVDQTGFPATGDTSLTHTNFVGKHVTFIREGQIQQQHTNNTTQDGFWLNNATGELRIRPALSAGEQIEIWSTNTIQWESLTAEGGGAESSLITGLRAFWQLDETSGTTITDVNGTNIGSTTGATNQPGKFGVAEVFERISSEWASINQTVGDVGLSDFALSGWFSIPSALGVTQGIIGNVYDYPCYYVGIQDDEYLIAKIGFTDIPGYITLTSNATVSTGVLHNFVLNCDRSGNATLYLDGVAQTDVEDISAGVAVQLNNNNYFGIGSLGNLSGYTLNGTVDAVGIWLRLLTVPEIATLQTKTWPWN